MNIGFSIVKRRRNGVPAARWSIRLRLADGRVVERVGFTDKAATQQLAAQMLREQERREAAGGYYNHNTRLARDSAARGRGYGA